MNKKDKDVEFNSILDGSSESEALLSSPTPEPKKKMGSMWKSIGIVALVVVILAGIFAGGGIYFEQQYQKEQEEAYNKDLKGDTTYFTSEETEPEKSETEVTALITEVYYTNDGSLAVRFCFANGMAEAQRLVSVEIKLRNGDGNVIATGYSDDIDKDYTIPADGTNTLLLYISPQYVLITDDPLSTIDYDVTTEYEPV